MDAAQLAFARTAVAFASLRGDDHGEAVLVTPRHAGAPDDRAFAAHAAFGWRAATQVVARPGGGALRYRIHRPIAVFAHGSASRAQIGDRITRCWDGAVFEVVAAYREGGDLCCELIECDARLH